MVTRTLLLDGDIIAFSLCSKYETEIRWSNEVHTLHSDAKQVEAAVKSRVDYFKELLETDSVIFVTTGANNFRKQVYPEYKGNRKEARKPLCLSYIKIWITKVYPSLTIDTLEADDVLGILSTTKAKSIDTSLGSIDLGKQKVIVSIDKDFESIPGLLWNPDKDKGKSPRKISEAQANYRFFTQALTGDATDGYPGCPGVGPAGAEKILKDLDPLDELKCWEAIVDAYKKKGLDEDYALSMARCARILRAEDYVDNQVKLWSPYDS